jgi:hypothetical protein
METFKTFLETLGEKASSENQQKLFGVAYAVKTGKKQRDEVTSDVLRIVDTMTVAEIKKYAQTKHDDIPSKIEETKVRRKSDPFKLPKIKGGLPLLFDQNATDAEKKELNKLRTTISDANLKINKLLKKYEYY